MLLGGILWHHIHEVATIKYLLLLAKEILHQTMDFETSKEKTSDISKFLLESSRGRKDEKMTEQTRRKIKIFSTKL